MHIYSPPQGCQLTHLKHSEVSPPPPALITINLKLKGSGEGTRSILNDVTCKTLGDPSAGRLCRNTLLLPCNKIHPGSNSGQPFGIQPQICNRTGSSYSENGCGLRLAILI